MASNAFLKPIDAGRLRRDCNRRTKVRESGIAAFPTPSLVVPPRTKESLADEATLARIIIDRYTASARIDAFGSEHRDHAFRTLLYDDELGAIAP